MMMATQNGNSRKQIDPIWWAPVLFVVIIGIVAMTALLFNGTLRKVVPLTLGPGSRRGGRPGQR